jgi:hypothetical protein
MLTDEVPKLDRIAYVTLSFDSDVEKHLSFDPIREKSLRDVDNW